MSAISRYPDKERQRWITERLAGKSSALIAAESEYDDLRPDTVRKYTSKHGTYQKPTKHAVTKKEKRRLHVIHPVFGFPV